MTLRLETTRDHLAAALALGIEVLRTPRFDPAEFEQMKTAWVSSIEESRNEPQALVLQRLERYGNPYPAGDVRYVMTFDESLQAIAGLKLDDVRAFYQGFYGASNAVVAAIGDFDAAALTAQLQTGLADWTSPVAFVRVPQPFVDVPATQFRIEVKDKQNAFSFGEIEFPLRESDREFQALRLAMQIFGGSGGSSGWLWDRIREKEGLSYGVGSSVNGGQFNANAKWYVYAIARRRTATGSRSRSTRRSYARAATASPPTSWCAPRRRSSPPASWAGPRTQHSPAPSSISSSAARRRRISPSSMRCVRRSRSTR